MEQKGRIYRKSSSTLTTPLEKTSVNWDNVLEDLALNYSQGQINNCIELNLAVVPLGRNLVWDNKNGLSTTEAVWLWVAQKKYYSLESGVCARDLICRHYTQVIWINSTPLGCAKVRCNNNSGILIACYYYPAGNIPGKHPTDGIRSLIQSHDVAPMSPTNSSPLTQVIWVHSTPQKGKSMEALVIGLSIGLAFGLVLMITCFISRQRRQREKESDDDRRVFNTLFNNEFGNLIGPRKFSLNELTKAKNNFNTENKLGEGGFGFVYRGFLRDLDTCIAVKKVSKASKQGIWEYASEVKIISRLRHKNLVKLIGWCHDRGELLLVYEFMPSGNLDTHLFKSKSLLTWETRFKIMQDLASACYTCMKKEITPAPWGTSLRSACHREKLARFGVVALEIACGRRSVEPKFQDFEAVLVPWVLESYGKGKVLDVADNKMGMGFDPKQMECLVMVGLWCAHPSQDQRPSIRQVIQALHFEAPLSYLPTTMPVLGYKALTASRIGSSEPVLESNITLTIPR
ncbi:Lateral organ boundaries domain family protein [Hibiscus syriacus]|uniref:Lateral organ boundaries domain family protein n=1 Tax=Hibiscus syriacus TaxID=106335 RepID=A0A6A3BG45_HIBSY|nr:Lateral organ boundaries domain family protein [Hibiscus syriacus]